LNACLVLWASLPEIKIEDDDDSLPVEVVGFYQELRILFFTGSEMRVEAKKPIPIITVRNSKTTKTYLS